MDCEMEEMRMKLGKRDLEITQIECENKVLKKMIRKYEDLVHGLRVTVRLKKIILNSMRSTDFNQRMVSLGNVEILFYLQYSNLKRYVRFTQITPENTIILVF